MKYFLRKEHARSWAMSFSGIWYVSIQDLANQLSAQVSLQGEKKRSSLQ